MAYRRLTDSRAYQRNWYHRNKEKRKATRARNRERILAWFEELKLTLRCIVCAENHPACLVFHHRNQRSKEFEVSVAAAHGMSIARLQAEIAKCDVLCVNCHLVLHAAKQKRSKRRILARKKGESPYALEP